MSLLTYTSYEEVRAALGVSSTELPDRTLAQPLYGTQVVLELEDVAVELPAMYDAINSLPPGTATNAQVRLVSLVNLFAPYSIAKQLLTSLPLFTVQSLTDGRAGFDRQSNANIYDTVREDVQAALAEVTLRLKACYYGITGTTATEPVATVSVLSVAALRGVDPVTNV